MTAVGAYLSPESQVPPLDQKVQVGLIDMLTNHFPHPLRVHQRERNMCQDLVPVQRKPPKKLPECLVEKMPRMHSHEIEDQRDENQL